ncbi:hypothetical protein J7T55_011667 [Diaporthe amygdali]|uniref:uncharacterized protein n=1 Tax=Phomopsis amygdali TaxID=1214568 RepID=UPI0022FE5D16|nr:uncharacterized protein J7T55_011667 [Diaporthe amygdali]KAJ0123203.1 hypothetical protein J7T55_011667 [Diaporthe amygdali]
MPGAPKKDGLANYNLTPREVEFTVKAMITLVENKVKPDFEKLAKMSNYPTAQVAARNWWHTAAKLKAAGNIAGGETSTGEANNGNAMNEKAANGKKAGKRDAADDPEAPPAKRGRGRAKNNVQPPVEETKPEDEV